MDATRPQPFLRQHPGANTDLLARIAIPLLFMHGDFEASFSAATIATLVAAPCRSASAYATGHSPFAEAPARFNAELAAFVAAAQRSTDRNDTKIAAQRGDADRNAPCSAAKGGLR